MGRHKKEEKALIIRRPEDVERDTLGMSRDFALTHLITAGFSEWSALQRKLFVIVLSGINWRESGNSNVIEIKNEDIMKKLDWELQKNDRRMTEILDDNLHYMAKSSYLELENPLTRERITRNLISEVKTNSFSTVVELNPKFMPHLENLFSVNLATKKSFITFMQPDVLSFSSSFAYPLFLELRSCGKSGGAVNEHAITTRRLKEIFGLDEDAYMRQDGHFDRTNFEKFVLMAAIKDINKSETITILPWDEKGSKFFSKDKVKGKVYSYIFKFQIWDKKKITRNRVDSLKKLQGLEDSLETDDNSIGF